MEFWEEFLPTQPEYSRLSTNPLVSTFCHEMELFKFICNFNGFENYDDLILRVPKSTPITTMASNPVTISLLQFLIRTNNIKTVLEIGTYIGISAIKMAQVLPMDGHIYTIEKGEEFAELATYNFETYKDFFCTIRLFNEDAMKWLSLPLTGWGLVFLDADKENYDKYLDKIIPIIKPGGLIVVDDVLFHGDVLNKEPTTAKGAGCKRLLEAAKTLPWAKVLLPLANGILLLRKPLE